MPCQKAISLTSVEVIDFIDLEAGNIIALTKMISAMSQALTDGDGEGSRGVLLGLAVVAEDIQGRVEAIKAKADQLYETIRTAELAAA